MNIEDLSPSKILREAIEKVPALKYAFGVLGLLAVLAIVSVWQLDLRIAVFGTLILTVLMLLLVVFTRLSSMPSKTFRFPSLVLLWFAVLTSIAAISLLVSSVFFSWPRDLAHWLYDPEPDFPYIVDDTEEEDDSTGQAVVLAEPLSKRLLSATDYAPNQFFVGLTDPNEIRRIDKNGNLIGGGLRLVGEPTMVIATNNQLFIATEFPAKIVVAPRDLSEMSVSWDLPLDRDILEKFGKSDAFDSAMPGKIRSFAVTNDSIWVNAADSNASIIYRIDQNSGQWMIPNFYDFDMSFSGRDWALHDTRIGVVAFSTETSPSSLYLFDGDEILTFGGHEYDLVSSTSNIWSGNQGAIGLLDSNDQIIEFDVRNMSLRPKARLGTLPPRQVEYIWEIVQGEWDNGRLWIAITETPIQESCALWTRIYQTTPQGDVETLTVLHKLTLKSFSVSGDIALVIGEDCAGSKMAYFVGDDL